MRRTYLSSLFLGAGLSAGLAASAAAPTPTPTPPAFTVSLDIPTDIPGGAPAASLADAALFAWGEFVAINWPAVPQTGARFTRDRPDHSKFFGDTSYSGPLAWHTYRGKVELFPGEGTPPGGTAVRNGHNVNVLQLLPDGGYGYDAAPQYIYQNGPIPTFRGLPGSETPPWINADETSQIGLDNIFAGVGPQASTTSPIGNQIVFLAKANRTEFDYIAPLGWWDSAVLPNGPTGQYVASSRHSPPPGSTNLVSFPNSTIELKSAWRKLGPNEDPSRFYTTKVRYYTSVAITNGNGNTQLAYVDDTLALVGLHIIQKTPSAPYFIFATFEQADNIVDANGKPIEDNNGNVTGTPAAATPMTPDISSTNATLTTPQVLSPTASTAVANSQLYYVNQQTMNGHTQGLTNGTILVNHREHAISSEVIAVNSAVHNAITAYVTKNLPNQNGKSPWDHYKLVSVQYMPIDKPTPGQDYTAKDKSTYYQANATIETDYDLQVFSGQFYKNLPSYNLTYLANTITDFDPQVVAGTNGGAPTLSGKPFKNVSFDGHGFNMGGCMGCHGNAQQGGGDFSFILLGGPVQAPSAVGGQGADQNELATLKKYFNRN